MENYHEKIITVVIGGAAGDGIREAGSNLGLLLSDIGLEVHLSFKYPSLIRGGHNYSRLSFSKEKIFYDHSSIDVLIALNSDTVKRHSPKLNSHAVVIAENFDDIEIKQLGRNALTLPLTSLTKQLNAPPVARSSIALGAICYLLDLSLDRMLIILRDVFKEKAMEVNINLAKLGYEHLEIMKFRHSKIILPEEQNQQPKYFVDGNTAFAYGLVSAGLEFYVAYPMTPSTSILHFLAKKQGELNIRIVQPENEIAVINMALGMAYAGRRVAIGTATGGFALMQEAFSLAGMAEIPLAIAVSQRFAPATGAPTHSSQADLRFVLHSGHGEFPRIILAPGDPEEAFTCGKIALNLAWKYQIPVVVLMDKHVSENSSTGFIDIHNKEVENGKIMREEHKAYGRYEVFDDGVSPMALPGTAGVFVKANSYEHDEGGLTTEDLPTISLMQKKRFSKINSIIAEFPKQQTVKTYGDLSSENVIVFWGSSKAAILEAAKFINKSVKLVQILWMEPFDTKTVVQQLEGAKIIIDIECNHNAQLAGLLREKTGIKATHFITRYDSGPLDAVELATQINSIID